MKFLLHKYHTKLMPIKSITTFIFIFIIIDFIINFARYAEPEKNPAPDCIPASGVGYNHVFHGSTLLAPISLIFIIRRRSYPLLCNGRARSGYPGQLRSGTTAHARETVFSKIQSSLDAAEGGASSSTPIYREVYHPRIKKSSVPRDSLFTIKVLLSTNPIDFTKTSDKI